MGASESKPTLAGHIWKASGPSSVSHDLLDSLQSNPETDASRARTVEIQIQARVAEELKKLQNQESEALKAAQDKIAAAANENKSEEGQSRHTVSKQVEEFRRKLEERKQVRTLPENVESARNEVIKCLTDNDRRPLNCYEEVEKFKVEVKKLEQQWVNKVVS
ncbi:hypothetical protein V2G26_016485 [Clonostachys chloroleuca]|uniref:MICOS complex subunit mic19 n=1 Tax=Clonostachys chloroleuca TaxID=1926264 RepID=A0AA35Q9M3_9HYPO|nr:unnamed protein product [Clonostachys chloroleuca]